MASRREEVLLTDDFTLLSKKKTINKVTVTRCGLFYGLNSSNNTSYDEKCIQISDIIGCHSLDSAFNDSDQTQTTTITNNLDEDEDQREQSTDVITKKPATPTNTGIPKPLDPSTLGFIVFAYPLRKKVFSGKKVRYRVVLGFSLLPQQSNEIYEERKKKLDIWINVLNCLCRDIPVNINDLPNTIPPPHGRMLILINPRSGPGKAHTIFKTQVQPLLEEAGIPHKALVTEYCGHATDMLKDIDLSEWYGIVIVSGDGLIFETINGLMSRGDWLTSIQTPIGCLPGGSGNALCCSINYAAGEPLNPNFALHSTFVLIKHRVVPMDLVIVHIPDKTIYSFLSVTWGIMADIDYESEKYRNLGEARFTVGALRRIIGLRTYKGRVSFLPVAEYHPKEYEYSSSSGKKILSKIRSFSLRSRSSSKSTLNSIEESSSPQLLKHRSLSMDQSGYSEAQLYRSDVESIQEDKFLSGNLSASFNSDSLMENGVDHSLPLTSFSEDDEDVVTSLSNPVVDSSEFALSSSERIASVAENSDKTTSSVNPAAESKRNGNISNGNGGGESSNSATSKSNDNNNTTAKTVGNGGGDVEDSVFSELNGNHKYSASSTKTTDSNSNSTSVDNNGSVNQQHPAHPRTRGHQKSKSDVSLTVMADETQQVKVEQETYTGNKADFSPVPTPLLPPLDQPVPDNWVTLEDDYILVCAVYQTHLGSDMLAAPDAHLNDGFIHLMMVKEGISRNALLNLFLTFGQGGHIHSPFVNYVKVLAFRLEPMSDIGNIMIDGERFDPSPLQAQILPGVAKIMAIQ